MRRWKFFFRIELFLILLLSQTVIWKSFNETVIWVVKAATLVGRQHLNNLQEVQAKNDSKQSLTSTPCLMYPFCVPNVACDDKIIRCQCQSNFQVSLFKWSFELRATAFPWSDKPSWCRESVNSPTVADTIRILDYFDTFSTQTRERSFQKQFCNDYLDQMGFQSWQAWNLRANCY